ncbi:MAG: hypothetical protein EOP61_10825 [Sphingomonadales bacterium]|nr:MAG: hypothetical protein EOP61_10825 [Sphingomonadales bacterium]
MSEILDMIGALREAGQPDAAILQAVIAMESRREHKLAQRREGDRVRQQACRARKNGHVVSRDTETVTRDIPLDGLPSTSLSSDLLLSLSAPPTDDNPHGKFQDLQRAHGAEILAICRKRADGAMAALPSMHDITPILRLLAPAAGEPCDLEADILPVIDRKVAEALNKRVPIRSWEWVRELALRNRDRRLSGNPKTEKINDSVGAKKPQRPGPSHPHAVGGHRAQHNGSHFIAAALRRIREGQQHDAIPDPSSDT